MLTIHNAEEGDLTSITLDGETVDSSNYTVTKAVDGVVLTFVGEYLKMLSEGSHSVCANFVAGKAETQITIKSEQQSANHYGDVDGDEQITANDALTVLRASVGMETLTPEQSKIADVDNDTEITANDALAVLRNSVGINDDNLIGKPVTA